MILIPLVCGFVMHLYAKKFRFQAKSVQNKKFNKLDSDAEVTSVQKH